MNMAALGFPTLGQLLSYLQELGFVIKPGDPGFLVCRHPNDDSWFIFRDRDAKSSARESEMIDVRVQLTYRGFVTEPEFARFWAVAVLDGKPES